MLSIVVLLAFLCVIFASEPSYTAGIESAGASGYFQMKLKDGNGFYQYSLDLTSFSTACDLTSGLTYHIHTYWTDVEKSSATTCGEAGGHYDPYLACGTSSEEKAGACILLNRTATQGYAYGCTSSNYKAGYLNLCEVGDLSGKFGRAMPSSADNLVFKAEHIDPSPPLAVHYGQGDILTKQWASVVFHCPADNARLFCAQLIQDKCSTGTNC